MTGTVSIIASILIRIVRFYKKINKIKMNFQLDDNIELSETKSLWVFGYGSLCWRPGFEFDKAVVGHIKGFSRKFWQGNDVHRGTHEKPGRVATLVEDNECTVYGIAFAISGETAISYLSQREVKLGGYDTIFTTFYPSKGAPIKNILLYIATPTNSLWLGDASISNIATEIIETKGICGYNVEYLLRLADFMRTYCPDEEDSHLFNLEAAVVKRIRDRKMCLRTLMGDGKECVVFKKISSSLSNTNLNRRNEQRTNGFQFSASLQVKSLRCLNV